MNPLIITLLVLYLVCLAASLWMIVAAFRVRPWWALMVLVPFGSLVFAVRHWPEARGSFLTIVVCGGAIGGILAANPDLLAQLKQFQTAYRQGGTSGQPAAASSSPVPHEARDLAGNAAPVPAVPAAVDPNAAARAAYAKHHAELTTLYDQLNAARTTLKPGPSTNDYNTRAAHYQDALRALAGEKTQLDAMDRTAAGPVKAGTAAPAGSIAPVSSGRNAEAAAALDRLRLMAGAGDYAGFAAQWKKCLADDRSAPEFPQMLTLARQTLPNATPDKLAAAVQRQTAAAVAEARAVTEKIRGIVNQKPPTVPRPPRGPEVWTSGFHPGAVEPDFDTVDLWKTREPLEGQFVHMETAPDVYYRSADCEFNAQTKYFITDCNVPEKRLSDAEYVELTRLYRIIGQDKKVVDTHAQRLADAGRAAGEVSALNTQLAALPAK